MKIFNYRSIKHICLKFLFIIPLLPAVYLFLFLPYLPAANRIVKIGVYENAPKIFTSDSGKPSGIFIDIIEEIARTEGWNLEFVHGTWPEGLKRLVNRDIDLMPDVAYSSEREKLFSFHKVHVISSWFQVYAPKGSKIKSILDLRNKSIIVLESSVQQEAFSRMSKNFDLNITLVPVSDYKKMFEIIAENKADAAITNRFYGLMHAQKYGLQDTAVIFNPTDLFYAAPKNANSDLLKAIDKHLTILKQDPKSVYYKSLNRWISEEPHFKLPDWLYIAGIILAGMFILSIGGTIFLKRQVSKRTLEMKNALQRFADIVEFLPDATFVVDQNQKIIAWNKACEEMTGVKEENLLGKGNYAYAKPFFGERRPLLIDLLDDQTIEAESIYKDIKRTDSRIFAEFHVQRLRKGAGAHLWGVASPLFDNKGKRCGAIESIRDITEQKMIEDALRTNERKYRELVMHANTIILHWTRDGRIIFINEFGLRFFGYKEDELFGKHVVGTIVPESETTGRPLIPLIESILANPMEFERNTNENIRKNGERVWIDWANRVVLDENGQVKEILSIGTDITQRKKAEDEIYKLNDELRRNAEVLEQKVEERTADLAEAMEQAKAADRIKSAFLASMSHELRTPLNSIIGFTGILLQGLPGPLNEEQQKQMRMIQNSSRHLLSLINDVLDISKIEAGQLELSVSAFEIRPSIERAVSLITPLSEKKGIELIQEIDDNIGEAYTDQIRFEQIIINLLNNAVKFTEKGYVKLSSGIENNNYIFSISDTGIGIKSEDIPGLFQPFHQIDSGLERRHEGTGLGLSICKRLVDKMQGSISVESEWGKGSIFTVKIPRSTGEIQ